MGSQVMEVVVWVFSIVIVSTFLGMIFQVLRGAFDGYMDRWQENYLGNKKFEDKICLLYTSPSPRDRQKSRMPSSA